jgi:NAD(P)-dependent dehydrogenase (short-subunit alcohol dehydrogenase family)
MLLKDKVAIVTGGGRGIGRGVALRYAKEGAKLALVDIAQGHLDETAKVLDESGTGVEYITLQGDVSSSADVQGFFDKTIERYGRLDVLVNNAAFQETQEKLEDISDEQFDTTFKTNIYGYFYMAKAAVKHLPRGGAIVNCGSITGLEGNKTLIDYASTKGAIHAFTKSLAQNLIDCGIRVNCVSPGPIWTPLQPVSKPADKVAEHGAGTPLKRPGQPEEVAPAFVFFASEADSSYINGEILTLLGGETRAG